MGINLVNFVLLLILVDYSSGLVCEVTFRVRTWYLSDGAPPTKSTSTSTSTTTTSPTTSTSDPTDFIQSITEGHVAPHRVVDLLTADNKTCVLHTRPNNIPSSYCGTFTITEVTSDQVVEYVFKDCVGYSKTDELSGCQLTTISNLNNEGIFLFEASDTFHKEFMDNYIVPERELTACLCKDDNCNMKETTVIYVQTRKK